MRTLAVRLGIAAAVFTMPASAGADQLPPDTTLFRLDTHTARTDRYALEVSFPSRPSARVIVDSTVNALLGHIDPSAIPNRTLVVYRDGRVVVGGGRPLGSSFGHASPNVAVPGSYELRPRLGVVDAHFTPYFHGTIAPTWGDYDRDGDLDLPMFRNDGDGTFSEMPGFVGVLDKGNFHGSAWCDYDHDGDLDLVMLGYTIEPTKSKVLQNQGDGTFVDVGPQLGMDVLGNGETPVWGDFDGDGDPDLFAPYYAHVTPFHSFLYRNDGGTFQDVADSAGVAMRGLPENLKPEGATSVDVDGDGDLDIYCASHLFLNDGNGRFTDVRAAVGLPQRFDEGAVLVDVDNDGDFDLYVRNSDTGRLFRNDGGHFTDVTAASGIPAVPLLWGDSFADVDNDGDLDLLYNEYDKPARLFLNRGDGTFVQDTDPNSYGGAGMSVWADVDDDGDLDFVDGAWPPYTLIVNHLENQAEFGASFLRVEVVDADSTENQQGATVRLIPLGGPTGVEQARAVAGGASYLGGNEYRCHFGLGVPGTVTRNPDLSGYDVGAHVTLTPRPAAGYHFAGWIGDVNGSANPLVVTMTRDLHVEARFERDVHTLTTSASGGGTIVKSPDPPSFVSGSRVVLEARPDPGWRFVSWSGGASGSTNPIQVTMDADRSVTATFAMNTYTVDVTTAGDGAVVKNPDQAAYAYGDSVHVTATPGLGSHFVGWSGDASGTANPLGLRVDRNLAIVAIFAVNTYPLTVAVSGSGTVTRSPDQALYEHGAEVDLLAVPGPEQRFVSWSGDASGAANPIEVILDRPRTVTATFAPIAHRTWVGAAGGGDGTSWADAHNWSGGVTPAPADEVVLDNGAVAADYTVTLPGGTASVTVSRLTIAPGSGRVVTLVVPSSSRAVPALFVGDGVAGTVDLRLAAGAVLRNASGVTSAGNAIQLSGTINGQMAIENGARYVHATLSNPAGVVAGLTTAPGTEDGVFEYDVPGRTSYAILTSLAHYGALTLTRTAGSATYTATGAGTWTVRGALTIQPGVTLTSGMSGDFVLGGDFVNDGTNLTLPAIQRAIFDGGHEQRLLGAAGLQLNGPSQITSGTTLAPGASAFTNGGAMTVAGTLRLDGTGPPNGAGTYAYDPVTGTLAFAAPSGTFPVDNLAVWPAVNAPAHVSVLSPDGITMNVSRTVPGTLRVAGPIVRADRLTLAGGEVRLEAGGSFAVAPRYSGAARLVYTTGAAVGPEWSAGASVGEGVPRDVTIDAEPIDAGTAVVTMPDADRTVPGHLTVARGRLALASGRTLSVGGDLSVDGALDGDGLAIRLVGPARQRIAGAGEIALGGLQLEKSAGPVALERDLALIALAGGTALALSGSDDAIELAGHRLVLEGGVAGSDAGPFLRGDPAAALRLGGSGTRALRFVPGTARLGTLTVDLAGGTLGPGPGLVVSDSLVLARGVVDAAADTLTVQGAVVRDGGWVAGALRRSVPAGAPHVRFDVGSLAVYAPLDLAFDAVSAPGSVTASSVAGDHPAIATSPLRPDHTLNRWWSVRGAGVAFTTYRATFAYSPSELDSATAWNGLLVRRYAAPAWASTQAGPNAAGSIEADAVAGFGDFAVGLPGWTLTLATTGQGSTAAVPDRGAYADGTPVIVTATPAAGRSFVGWGGDTVCTTNPLILTMRRNRSLKANFTYAVDVIASGGSVTRSPNQTSYVRGALVTLTAVPAAGSHFTSWGGDTVTAANPMVVRVDHDVTFFANFVAEHYTLATTATAGGSVSRTPDQPDYLYGTAVVVHETPARGYHFTGWSGDTTAHDSTLALTMTRSRTLAAAFVLDSFAVSVSKVGNGTVSGTPSAPLCAFGTAVTLTATPAAGQRFVGWSGDTAATTGSIAIVVTRARTLVATFEPIAYTLTLTKAGSGTLVRTPDLASYPENASVRIAARPALGYRFQGWSGDTTAKDTSLVLVMNRNRSLTATFADPSPPTIRVLWPNGGEALGIGATMDVQWTASDTVGVVGVDLYLSRHGAMGPFEPIATNQANDGRYSWTVTGPTSSQALLLAIARDQAGNTGADVSDATFSIGTSLTATEAAPVTELALEPIAPNPMRERAIVEYALPAAADVRLDVLDLQGRSVAVLDAGTRAAGRHHVLWSGQTGDGKAAPGIYFVRFEADGVRRLRRLAIAR